MKKENNIFKQENRLVGGLVPYQLADKLSLYCVYKDVTRSKIIASLLETQLASFDEEEMIEKIGMQLGKKVEGLPISKKAKLLTTARNVLSRKKVNQKHINQIIKIARYFHAKDED